MKAVINSLVLNGLEVIPTTITATVQPGIGIHLVGLNDTAVKESLLRVVTALQSLGYRIPGQKITVDISPKVGPTGLPACGAPGNSTGLDAAIALSILQASKQISLDFSYDPVVVGELGLDASMRGVNGGLNFIEWAAAQQGRDISLVLPESMVPVGMPVGNRVVAVRDLSVLIKGMSADSICPDIIATARDMARTIAAGKPLCQEEKLLEQLPLSPKQQRALEVAVAGGFDIVAVGDEGSGRGMLAEAYSLLRRKVRRGTILDLSYSQALTADAMGEYKASLGQRFFPLRGRYAAANIGGTIKEMCLAHNGVLMVSDALHTPKSVLESIRTAHEDGQVVLSRLSGRYNYPAVFNLFLMTEHPTTTEQAERLVSCDDQTAPRSVIIDADTPSASELKGKRRTTDESVSLCRKALVKALTRQQDRTNAELPDKEVYSAINALPEAVTTLDDILEKAALGMKERYRILRIARTIADLEDSGTITTEHIREAASMRFLQL